MRKPAIRANRHFVSRTGAESQPRRPIMRPYSVGGIILIVLGVLALSIHSITYFSHEQVAGPLGFFAWDVWGAHTIFFNPIPGVRGVVIGIVVAMTPRRQAAI